MREPDLSVVIVSHNTQALLSRCIDTLRSATPTISLPVIVVDNASTDGTTEHIRTHYPTIRLIENATNVGFAQANNQGLAEVTTPFALLLNSDAFLNGPALERCMELLRPRPFIAVVGLQLLNPDGTVQARHGKFPNLVDDVLSSIGLERVIQRNNTLRKSGPVDWVQGACMFVRVEAVRQVGGLDPSFFMYSEEVEWCFRFWKRGWQVWYEADSSIGHLGGASSSENDLGRRVALYRSRLGFRRQVGGSVSSAALWTCMLAGLTLRLFVRPIGQTLLRREFGRQSTQTDRELLREIVHMDPFARWVQS